MQPVLPLQVVVLMDQQAQREQEGQAVGYRAGPQHPLHPQEQGQDQSRGHKENDLTGQGENGGLDRLAHRLEIDCRHRLEPGKGAEHQENAEGLYSKLVIKPLLGTKQHDYAHGRELENQKGYDGHHLRGDEGNFQGFFHPLEVLGTVVETDDGLGTGGDAQQNGNHDLVDLHHR